MPSVTLRPNATYNTPQSVTGAATAHAATSDDSDASYFYLSGTDPGCGVNLGTFSLPAGAVTKQVRARARCKEDSGGGIEVYLQVGEHPSPSWETDYEPFNTTTSWVTYALSYTAVSLTQSQIDNLGIYCVNSLFGIGGATNLYVSELYADIDYALRPSAPTVSNPTGTITSTLRPVTSWTFNAGTDGGGQTKFQVKVFSAAQYGAGGFNPETSTPTLNSNVVTSGVAQWTPSTNLSNGTTYRAYVKTAATTNGVDQWSDWAYSQFSVSISIPTPTGVLPAGGSSQTTSLPALDADGGSTIIQTKRQWRVATDSGYTTNYQLLDEGVFRQSHTDAGSIAFPGTALAQGTWYISARFGDDIGGFGSWSANQTFTITHPPSAALVVPVGGISYQYASPRRVQWTFSDPYIYDLQSAYQVEFWKASDKVGTLIDTGKVVSTNAYHDVTGFDATWKDVELRWRVRLYDQNDVVGSWSAEGSFYLRDLPTSTIDSPTNGGTVNTSQPVIQWTFSASGGRTQAKYRVLVTDTDQSLLVADSGLITSSSATQWQVDTPVITVGPNYSVEVQLTDNTGLVGTDTNTFTASYTAVEQPTLVVDGASFFGSAAVYLDWAASTVDANMVGWRVYRRISGATIWKLIYDGTNAPNTKNWIDYTCPSDTPVEYGMVQVADDGFGGYSESAYTVVPFEGTCDKYFLVVPAYSDYNIQLYHVTSDDFSDEIEFQTINLVGRGRRVEYGTRFGQTGSLTASLFDNEAMTAREQRLWIESLRQSREVIYLRNPFGDVWEVALTNASFSRVAGVGLREFTDVTIEYVEVTA